MVEGIALIALSLGIGAFCGVFNRLPNQKVTEGEIVGKRTRYYRKTTDEQDVIVTYIKYTVDGHEYTMETTLLPRWYDCGKKIRIAYDAQSPERSALRPFLYVYVIMALMAITGIVSIFLH